MSRVLSRVGLSPGRVSRTFTPAELIDAVADEKDDCVYVEIDAAGWIVCAGAARRGGTNAGAGGVAVRARLAPDVHARNALVMRAGGSIDTLQLRVEAEVPPLHELLVWLDEELLALAGVPFLGPINIHGKKDYSCHECGARFEQPNILKAHLYLSCATVEPRRFWRAVGERLRAATAPAPSFLPPALALSAAELEALATEWGRARGGHLCIYCGKAYSRKYGLKIHIRTHTGYRPLRCRYCARAFGDPSNLNKHMRLHGAGGGGGSVGAARHSCSVCGRTLARRRDLERHERAHALAR
ncbi:zinc finger protein ZFMSA12A [Manduca sexta]|uniref:zinc finger protein ZFMSA12A n=1 Tax=Manduca sexta TaxID=7130 RepID=UPI0011838020|nr:zinc finger protein ZFMSA12A [Manduca sexta]